MQPVPILTYHGTFIDGNDYATNHHVALAHDLAALDALGHVVVPLPWVIDALLDQREIPEHAVALTMDDGTDFDFRDLVHPTCGLQRSMWNVLRDFVAAHGADRQPHLNITSFVIASPQARDEIDRKCLVGQGWYGDGWWSDAQRSGLMTIANHSWDHAHPAVSHPPEYAQRGDFLGVHTREHADYEVRQAAAFIARTAPGSAADLFAYPYGHHTTYLREEYFPSPDLNDHTRAAFTIDAGHVADGRHRFALPRYVFGEDWRTPEDFARVLANG